MHLTIHTHHSGHIASVHLDERGHAKGDNAHSHGFVEEAHHHPIKHHSDPEATSHPHDGEDFLRSLAKKINASQFMTAELVDDDSDGDWKL